MADSLLDPAFATGSLLYLSFTPTFFYGWALSKSGNKLQNIKPDPIRLGLLSPMGFLYLVISSNLLAWVTNFGWFNNLGPTLLTLNNFFKSRLGLDFIFKDLSKFQPADSQEFIIIVTVLYLLFLVYIPIRFGKVFAQRYAAKKNIIAEFIEVSNQLKNIKDKTASKLELAKSRLKVANEHNLDRLMTLAKADYYVNSIFTSAISIIEKFAWFVFIVEAVERFFFRIFLLRKIIVFSIEFLTKNSSIEEIETTKGWGVNLVTIDISTTESRLISGILKDYHSNDNSSLQYFTIEKTYKREKLNKVIKYNQHGAEVTLDESFSVPVFIPGNSLIVPIDKVVDFNLFKTKKEAHFNIKIDIIDLSNPNPALSPEDEQFILKALSSKIGQYHSGRVSYVKLIFFYPKNFSLEVEKILNSVLSNYEFVTAPEYVEYEDPSKVNQILKRFYSWIERIQYDVDGQFVISRHGGEIHRYTRLEDKT